MANLTNAFNIIKRIFSSFNSEKLLRRIKIHIRLIIAFLILSILPLVLTGTISYRLSSTAVDSKIRKYSEQIITQAGEIISRELQKYDTLSGEMIVSQDFQNYIAKLEEGDSFDIIDSTEKLTLLATSKFSFIDSVSQVQLIIKKQGFLLYNKSAGTGFGVENIELQRKADLAGGKSVWSLETRRRSDGALEPYIVLIRTVKSMDLVNVGYLMIVLDEKSFSETYKNIDIGDSSELFIIDKKGRVVSSRTTLEVSSNYKDSSLSSKTTDNNEEKVFSYKQFLISHNNIANTDWFIVGKVPFSYLNKEIDRIEFLLITIIIICVILIIVLTKIITKSISIPLNRLNSLMSEAKNGDLPMVIKDESSDEIGIMFSNFNIMLDNIRNLIDQLVISEKMVSLGRLVAGITHEINTPVGVSVTAASFMKESTQSFKEKFDSGSLKRSDLANYIDMVDETLGILVLNLNKASDQVKSFKQIAVDQSVEEKRLFDVREYINEILLSLKPKLKKTKLAVKVDCQENLYINSYAGGFSQILTNFVGNSILHGFNEGEEGNISISVSYESEILELIYSDDGKGIEKEDLSKIFDPFFTTKRGFGGTGLGLNIVYNIVTQGYKGSINCESMPGKGTTFIIKIPMTESGN